LIPTSPTKSALNLSEFFISPERRLRRLRANPTSVGGTGPASVLAAGLFN
jgi:hypothetical protein